MVINCTTIPRDQTPSQGRRSDDRFRRSIPLRRFRYLASTQTGTLMNRFETDSYSALKIRSILNVTTPELLLHILSLKAPLKVYQPHCSRSL